MGSLGNKISNSIGTALPQWVKQQLKLRSDYGSNQHRDDTNIEYLLNKTAWIRVISSVNIDTDNSHGINSDLVYFRDTIGIEGIVKPEDLSKKYALFGGTAQYLNPTKTPLRSGIGKNGAYGMLGDNEIQQYGYRPMPGIIDAKIETQGMLGSIKKAVINFKVWDKMQLDIIDALYFKLGYTMLIEWGQTMYVKYNKDPAKQIALFNHSEFDAIPDPFAPKMTKEKLMMKIAQNSRQSEGNYCGMLGMVNNFSFSFNPEGGYDCMISVISLGVLGESTKINNTSNLPDVVKDQITKYLTLTATQENQAKADAENARRQEEYNATKTNGGGGTPPATNGSVNSIIIGDSGCIIIQTNVKRAGGKARVLGDQGESTLWYVGKDSSWLTGALKKYAVNPNVTIVIITMGANDLYQKSTNVSGLVTEIKAKFPNAKYAVVQGSWGWGKYLKNTEEKEVDAYYAKWKSAGVTVLDPKMGKVATDADAHNDNSDALKAIGKAITAFEK
jgi:hypothetical protein